MPGEVVGLKAPQAALPQVTDQVTPAAAESSLTTAVRFTGVLITRFAGGLEIATEITGVPVTVMVAEADFVASVTEVATTTTVFPVGMAAGAV